MASLLKNKILPKRKTSITQPSNSHSIQKQSSCSKSQSTHREQQDHLESVPSCQLQGRRLEELHLKTEVSCQNYFLRKTILVLYKFFQRMERRWNLSQLTYRQMTICLKQLKYIKYTEADIGAQNSQQLKKCYYLWVNLAQGRFISLSNLMIILCHIQHLQIDLELIKEVVAQLQKGIDKFSLEKAQNGDPNFIFLVKREGWISKQNLLSLTEKQIRQVQKDFASFRYTRLAENEPRLDFQQQTRQEQSLHFMSKRSIELAGNKRQKILKQLKERQTNIQTIQLYHILNYREDNTKIVQSKIQECMNNGLEFHQLSDKKGNLKKKEKNMPKKTINNNVIEKKRRKALENKENKNENRSEINKKGRENKKEGNEHLCDTFGDDLGLSEIVKTQIIDEIQWNDVQYDDNYQIYTQASNNNADLECSLLPQSLLARQVEKQKKRRQYIDIPILYVDVNIQEGKKERIIVYEGDTAAELAQQFGKKHGLSQETVERLVVMLKQQIGSVLTKIDEAVEEDCSYLY